MLFGVRGRTSLGGFCGEEAMQPPALSNPAHAGFQVVLGRLCLCVFAPICNRVCLGFCFKADILEGAGGPAWAESVAVQVFQGPRSAGDASTLLVHAYALAGSKPLRVTPEVTCQELYCH